MSQRYSLHRQAHTDLDEIAEYLILNSRGGESSATRVLRAVEQAFGMCQRKWDTEVS